MPNFPYELLPILASYVDKLPHVAREIFSSIYYSYPSTLTEDQCREWDSPKDSKDWEFLFGNRRQKSIGYLTLPPYILSKTTLICYSLPKRKLHFLLNRSASSEKRAEIFDMMMQSWILGENGRHFRHAPEQIELGPEAAAALETTPLIAEPLAKAPGSDTSIEVVNEQEPNPTIQAVPIPPLIAEPLAKAPEPETPIEVVGRQEPNPTIQPHLATEPLAKVPKLAPSTILQALMQPAETHTQQPQPTLEPQFTEASHSIVEKTDGCKSTWSCILSFLVSLWGWIQDLYFKLGF